MMLQLHTISTRAFKTAYTTVDSDLRDVEVGTLWLLGDAQSFHQTAGAVSVSPAPFYLLLGGGASFYRAACARRVGQGYKVRMRRMGLSLFQQHVDEEERTSRKLLFNLPFFADAIGETAMHCKDHGFYLPGGDQDGERVAYPCLSAANGRPTVSRWWTWRIRRRTRRIWGQGARTWRP